MLALVLTMAVMYIWSSFFAPQPPPPSQTPSAEAPAAQAPAAPVAAAPEAPTVAPEEIVPERAEALDAEGWSGTLSSDEGALELLTLEAYRTEPKVTPIWSWAFQKITGQDPGPWHPYEGGGEPSVVLGEQGALAVAGAGAFTGQARHHIDPVDGGWQATRKGPDGLVITKTFRPGEKPYTVDVSVQFQNQGAAPVTGLWAGVLGTARKLENQFENTTLPVGYADGEIHHLEDPAEVALGASIQEPGPLGWFGFGNRYFMAVLLPQDPAGVRLVFDDVPDGRVGAFAVDDAPLAPGQSRTLAFTAFVGPKDLGLLERMGNELDEAVEFGFFGFFSKVLLFLLEVFQKVVVNWGLAIIVLTFTVKLIFFPLTQKSLVSSRRMQLIQPRLKEVQAKYKDDPMKQQQETMKLFQENQVNPLGGCLPMLVQIPVWFGLYSCLMYAVELYNSSFLYVRDLTSADPYAVLPTLAAVLFYVQQAMTPMTGMDPMQQKIMKFMPVIFGIFLYNMPSGLVFYITVNAILSILQTWVLNKTMPAPPVAPA